MTRGTCGFCRVDSRRFDFSEGDAVECSADNRAQHPPGVYERGPTSCRTTLGRYSRTSMVIDVDGKHRFRETASRITRMRLASMSFPLYCLLISLTAVASVPLKLVHDAPTSRPLDGCLRGIRARKTLSLSIVDEISRLPGKSFEPGARSRRESEKVAISFDRWSAFGFSAKNWLPFRDQVLSSDTFDPTSIMRYPSRMGSRIVNGHEQVAYTMANGDLITPNLNPSAGDVQGLNNLYGVQPLAEDQAGCLFFQSCSPYQAILRSIVGSCSGSN